MDKPIHDDDHLILGGMISNLSGRILVVIIRALQNILKRGTGKSLWNQLRNINPVVRRTKEYCHKSMCSVYNMNV